MVLQSIRDRLTGIIAIFIFAILIIPFAFVGVNSYFTSDAVNAVAVVNDQEITVTEFNADFQNYRRRMQAQMGDRFDPEYFDQAIIRRQFLDQLIDEELMGQVSVDAGLAVDNDLLAREIREIEGFNVDGEFNADVYQSRLASQGMTPKQFEEQMRVSLIVNQFPDVIGNSAISTSWELADYAKLMDQQRTFKALVVPAVPAIAEDNEEDSVQDGTEGEAAAEEVAEAELIEEGDIQAWYDDHLFDYQSEEMVSIEYIELDASTLGGSIEPDEAELRARFEEQASRFITPEARLASHILLEVDTAAPDVDVEAARQLAEDYVERIRAGEDFAVLAQEFSQDVGSAEEGGDLGWVEPGFMVQAFEDGLYELSIENPVSDPVRTGFGWHVILLRDIRPSEGMTFTEARDLLLEEYKQEADERRYLEQADRMVDIIYEDPTTLDAAAAELGMEVLTAGPFGRQGEDFGVAANMNVVNASFSDLVLGQGVVSDPVDLGDNHIVLIRLLEHIPEAQLPLEDVRDQVVASIRADRASAVALATAEELLASLTAGETIESLAEARELELVEAEAVTRYEGNVDPALRTQVFLMPRPGEDGPTTEVVETSSGYAVVQLDTVTDGEVGEEDALRLQAYRRRISSASANTEVLGFIKMLRKQSNIEVFEDRL